MAKMNDINAVGRRKKSVARVFMFSGRGNDILVNNRKLVEYFNGRPDLVNEVISPFEVLGQKNEYLIKVNVNGGGIRGQAGAIKLGISRVLAKLDEQTRRILRKNGFLTRDARMVERKKIGKHKARKSIQYSKR
jgi:small subunit ribosomal protein S9